MIRGIAVLLLFQLLGESLVFLTGLTVPGPAVGLVLLFLGLQATRQLGAAGRASLECAADGLLANLGLLFVPAGVGVVALRGMVADQAAAIGLVLVFSAIITLLVTVWTFLLTRRLLGQRDSR
jgi:holin-like protein